MAHEKILGIDLGTTYSCMAIMEAGKPIVIPNAEGGRTTASIVAFTKDGERLVGSLAKRQAVTNPQRTIQSIKRKMGSQEKVKIDDKEYTPQEISAMILQKLKIDAEAYLGEKITKAVVTVPAYFNDAQRTRRPRMPGRSPGSMSCGSSTNRPRAHLPMASTRSTTSPCSSTILAAARSMYRS